MSEKKKKFVLEEEVLEPVKKAVKPACALHEVIESEVLDRPEDAEAAECGDAAEEEVVEEVVEEVIEEVIVVEEIEIEEAPAAAEEETAVTGATEAAETAETAEAATGAAEAETSEETEDVAPTAAAKPESTKDAKFSPFLAKYHLPDPYPIPLGLSVDKKKGKCLAEAYAGKHSELSALTQYIIHHEACNENESAVAEELAAIAMVEMHHLDMLGCVLNQLGVSVALQARYPLAKKWTAKYNKLGGGLRERLELNIAGEKKCIEGYQSIICEIDDERIAALLERIVKDEELHITLLEDLLAQA